MAVIELSPLIGKRALNGAWIIPPPPVTPEIHERLQRAMQGTASVRVQIRPTVAAPDAAIASEVLAMAARLVDEIRQTGACRVVMSRGGIPEGSRRRSNHDVQTFEVGKVYELSVVAALRVLNSDPYRYLFEEVSASGEARAARPITNNSDVAVQELLEQNRNLLERVLALEAQKASAAIPTTKRNLKAALSDADAQES